MCNAEGPTVVAVLFAVIAGGTPTRDALADDYIVARSKKLRHPSRTYRCASHDRCGLPVACPDGTCYSLYGAYGPWGGPCDNLEMVGQVMDPLIH